MDILVNNSIWMLYNIFLAMVAVFFGWFMIKTNKRVIQIGAFLLWFFFVPNTIYMITDLIHLPTQWMQNAPLINIGLIIQYIPLTGLGIVTFIAALVPFEILLSRVIEKERHHTIVIVVLNFIIAFGVILGRIPRLNSWDIVLDPLRVLMQTHYLLTTKELMLMVLLFGIISNLVYYVSRDRYRKYIKNTAHF